MSAFLHSRGQKLSKENSGGPLLWLTRFFDAYRGMISRGRVASDWAINPRDESIRSETMNVEESIIALAPRQRGAGLVVFPIKFLGRTITRSACFRR